MLLIHIMFFILLALISIPVLVFCVQVFFALLTYHSRQFSATNRPAIAVLIPAHNEENGILATLASVKSQLMPLDQLIVIADNCTDNTAALVRANGVIAIERSDDNRRGKGYALDFGVRYLESGQVPEVVVIVDADCLLAENALETLALLAVQANRPIQSLYLMLSPEGANVKTKVAEFAWVVKNWVRALGFRQLGLPCQLMGTGMAFPWALLQKAKLDSGHIVEDLKLGLDLAKQNYAPIFCPEAVVTSVFPLNNEGVGSQRTRWEHGHLDMIVQEGLGLIFKSVITFNIELFAMALDFCVPPLASLVLFMLSFSIVSMIVGLLTASIFPWLFSVLVLLMLLLFVALSWFKFGREIIQFKHVIYIFTYIFGKIPLYFNFILNRQVDWVRSRRD